MSLSLPHLLFPQFMDDSLGDRSSDSDVHEFGTAVKVCPAVGVWFCAVGGYAAGNQMGRKRRHMTIRHFTEELEEIE